MSQQTCRQGQLNNITNSLCSCVSFPPGGAGDGQEATTGHMFRDDSGLELMDDSLTDMQWLQKMDAGAEIPGIAQKGRKRRLHVKGKHKDGCRKKLDYSFRLDTNKPPLSYASIIALAICSAPQKMMTLSSIYRWIEGTFPFYRTPEAKAWKNSIRHNLSIRKNMFMKVYQYPPRRGNGSYWTLLSDGEEELKRAVPLFSTLHPPIIDETSVYNHTPSTHTVKSKGQYVPVLPNVRGGIHPAFFGTEVTVKTSKLPHNRGGSDLTSDRPTAPARKTILSVPPSHLHDHSYAGQCLDGRDVEEIEKNDSGHVSQSSDHARESNVDAPSSKRRKTLRGNPQDTLTEDNIAKPIDEREDTQSQPTTSTNQHETSFNLLDTSFLTPVKKLPEGLEIPSISFSPLYNFMSPQCGAAPASLSSPFRPLDSFPATSGLPDIETGVFSTPVKSNPLKFSTPLSPALTDFLSPNTFLNQPDMFSSLKDFDSSPGTYGLGTPLRPGSLKLFGLLGLTPPPGQQSEIL